MPYKSQVIKLPKKLDRRVKLLDEDKEHIRHLYSVEKKGVREIARLYEGRCSRRLIQFTLFPERLKKMQEKHRKEEHWKTYFDRKKLTDAVRSNRRYKQELYLKGKIELPEEDHKKFLEYYRNYRRKKKLKKTA